MAHDGIGHSSQDLNHGSPVGCRWCQNGICWRLRGIGSMLREQQLDGVPQNCVDADGCACRRKEGLHKCDSYNC